MNLPLVKGVGGCSARMDKWRKHILWNIPLAPFTRGKANYLFYHLIHHTEEITSPNLANIFF